MACLDDFPRITVGDATVFHGSNLDVLPFMADNSVDSIVCDPPYELGFMGKKWDSSGIAYSVELWRECLRVLKPGGHLLAFGGSRTWHRLAVAIEDAGFDVRDSIAWLYGSGFPKSHDISKAIDKNNGESDRKLKFTLWFRSAGLSVKQVTDVLRLAGLISQNGTMARHFFAHSNAGQPAIPTAEMWCVIRPLIAEIPKWVDELVERIEAEREVIGKGSSTLITQSGTYAITNGEAGEKWQPKEYDITAAATEEAKKWQGWGTALKPAFEPVVVARKPLVGTVAENVLAWGVGGLNIDASRIAAEDAPEGRSRHGGGIAGNGTSFELPDSTSSMPAGRWPANVMFDEYTAGLLDEQSGVGKSPSNTNRTENKTSGWGFSGVANAVAYGDSGGASRFFYVAKASKRDRNEGLDELPKQLARKFAQDETTLATMPFGKEPVQNFHPTVKPTDLMRYLIKLVTPAGGIVLDPFTGSGSTGKAALLDGYRFIGIELTEDYLPIIEGRLRWADQEHRNQVEASEAEAKETLF